MFLFRLAILSTLLAGFVVPAIAHPRASPFHSGSAAKTLEELGKAVAEDFAGLVGAAAPAVSAEAGAEADVDADADAANSDTSTSQRGRCGTNEPSASNLEASSRLVEEARLNPNISVQALRETLELQVYFHVISDGNSILEGEVMDQALGSQLAIINSDYKTAGITFSLANITRTTNSSWYNAAMNTVEERDMKHALRQGSYRDINVYFANLRNGVLGWCSFPESNPTESQIIEDGCMVTYSSLPGGTAPYNLGRTLTHELGHWFNLYHTFQGGCSAGDAVDDTPAQAHATYGCPTVTVDTCTGDEFPGTDPIHNFMDYSDDNCMTEFTEGQITRMFQSFSQFRQTT